MAKYWGTCAAGLEFTVAKELEKLEGTHVISDSLFFGGVLFQTSCSVEKVSKLRSLDNIYAFLAHFQIDWSHAFDIFRKWNQGKPSDFLLGTILDGEDGSLLFRVSCDRTCTNVGRHGFTSVDAEAAIGEGIHYLFGWPASMRLYDLEVVVWIRDAEILLAIALLQKWNGSKLEVLPVSCHQDASSSVSDLMDPLVEIRTNTKIRGLELKPRPRRVDSQLYARRLYRKALVETSLKPSTAFSLVQLAGEVQPGHLIIDPMCGCGTIPFEAAECLSGQVMCIAGDIAHKAIAASERNLEDLKEPCDVLHWDATRLPLRTGCVDHIICDMPFGVRCGNIHVRQWLCPKVLREMIRVLAPETGIAVLMVHGKMMRKELEVNQKPFLRLLKHLNIQMEGIRVELFVMQRTSEPAKPPFGYPFSLLGAIRFEFRFFQIMDGGNKRTLSQLDSEHSDRNGRNKRHNPGSDRDAIPAADDTVYRILCPGNKIGSVIGKGGGIIKSLRSDTHAKITIADGIPGVDERVIIIFSSAKERKDRKDKDEDSSIKDGSDMKPLCPAQDALFRVHARIVYEEGASDDDADTGKQVTVRLLVPNNQIGCVIGKGGNVIEKMRTDTGAQIRILPKDQLPPCALNTDELIQISGDSSVVKKALYEVSARLHENPPKGRLPSNNPLPVFNQNPFAPPGGHLFSPGNILPQGNQLLGPNAGAQIVGFAPQVPGFGGYRSEPGASWPLSSTGLPVLTNLGGIRGREEGLSEEFSFQLLCPNDKIGGVIGKGGSSINQVRQETGATVKIADAVPESDERVIVISATEYLGDRVSPTIAAVIQLQLKASEFTEEEEEGKEKVITTRFLVPSNHIGCLLGKGGSIITEMRRRTQANIRILNKENLPKCASKNDELVQIVGVVSVARDALFEIATRLRANLFKDKEGAANAGSLGPASLPFIPLTGGVHDSSNFGGRQELASPGRVYSLSGYGLQGAAGGRLSSGSYGNFGNIQGGGASGYGSLSGYPTSRTAGVGSSVGLVKKNVSGTTVEVTIPNAAVGSILGRGGSNINQIRQISGAKVKLHDSKTGETDRIVEISGTPEQTHAAESLLQAFAMSGQITRSNAAGRTF